MITTPRCTTIPPLVRPTSPRQPWRRAEDASWRMAAPAANADKPLHKCNSGGGNGSELVGPPHHQVDCDPGNSVKNNGGD